MAQRVQIILEDDYDGGDADETVTFGLDGAEYEIDLSSENAAACAMHVAPWLAHARKIGGRKRTRAAAAPRAAVTDSGGATSDIRAWAIENGMEVSSRGRISSEVRQAYERLTPDIGTQEQGRGCALGEHSVRPGRPAVLNTPGAAA